MRRREFITLVGSATAWPLTVHAQQLETTRRIGVLMDTDSDDRLSEAGLAAFNQALQKLGWTVGRQVQIDTRWGENNEDLDQKIEFVFYFYFYPSFTKASNLLTHEKLVGFICLLVGNKGT